MFFNGLFMMTPAPEQGQGHRLNENQQTPALFYVRTRLRAREKITGFRRRDEESPFPSCGGRLEPLPLLCALEEFADAVYVITCPEGVCRYFEGNLRARKRADVAARSVSGIGLEKERVGIVVNRKDHPTSLAGLTAEIMERIKPLSASPVLSTLKRKGRKEENHHDYR
jgi:coenzyme F420-reducing hydrogenase delta subunit